MIGTGDFDGDGKADFVWHNNATGQVSIDVMDGFNLKSSGSPGTVPDLGWQIRP
jgi:hypothetical protein